MKNLYLEIRTHNCSRPSRISVYRYVEDEDFHPLVLAYAEDDGPVSTVELLHGERIPAAIRGALADPEVIKCAFDAQFTRICLSRCLNYPAGKYLPPDNWRCVRSWAHYWGLPDDQPTLAAALKIPDKGYAELNEITSKVCTFKGTMPFEKVKEILDFPTLRWDLYLESMIKSISSLRRIAGAMLHIRMPEEEWNCYAQIQKINDRGITIDHTFVAAAMSGWSAYRDTADKKLRQITDWKYPIGADDFRYWLMDNGFEADSLSRQALLCTRTTANANVQEAIDLWSKLAMTSPRLYANIHDAVCGDGKLHGLFSYCGRKRCGFGYPVIRTDNLPVCGINELTRARESILSNTPEESEYQYPMPNLLSELLCTSFVPAKGHKLIVAEYPSLNQYILRWLAKKNPRTFCEEASRAIPQLYVDLYESICTGMKEERMVSSHGLWFCGHSGNLAIQLPSKRTLTYRSIRVPDLESLTGHLGEGLQFIRGIVTDIVQGIARDLLAFSISSFGKTGDLPVVMLRPNGLVIEVPEDADIVDICDTFCRKPRWACALKCTAKVYTCRDFLKISTETTRGL